MLVYLCDECHGPLRPEEFREQAALGAARHLCKTCLERKASAFIPAFPSPSPRPSNPAPPEAALPLHSRKEAPRSIPQASPPTPVPARPRSFKDAPPKPRPEPPARKDLSCDGCQVADSSSQVPGGSWGDKSNPFCATCEKISPLPGLKFRCHTCKSMVGIDDLRSGRAVSIQEKVFCSTCRRRAQAQTPAMPLQAATKRSSGPPAPLPPQPAKRHKTAAVAVPPAPESGPEEPGPLCCDMCSRTFSLEDLRTGRAEIRDSRVLCPRCIAKLDRKKERFDYRFIASLVFIIVVFPVSAAGLAFLAIQGGFSPSPSSRGKDRGKPANVENPPPLEAPPAVKQAAVVPPASDRPPLPPKPADPAGGGEVRGIPREALDQIIANLRNPPAPSEQPTLPELGAPLAGSRGPVDAADIPALVAMAGSADPAQRLESILRLASVECDDQVFVQAVTDRDPFVRSAAAVALARRKKESAVAPLLELIRDPDPSVRRTASRALLDAVNVNVKFVEDFSREDLEKLRDRLDSILAGKVGNK